MFIQNVSMADVVKGKHDHVPGNTALIQIQDYGCFQFAKPAKKFVSVHQFKFDDDNDPSRATNITDEQSQEIADILKNCYENNISVVVHCHAGICRSGAVAEIGIIMGFENRGRGRIPNTLVARKLLKALGMLQSWD